MLPYHSVCIDEKTIQKISNKEVERLHPKLYEFYQKSIKHKVIKVFQNDNLVILDDEKRSINLYNYKYQTKVFLIMFLLILLILNFGKKRML